MRPSTMALSALLSLIPMLPQASAKQAKPRASSSADDPCHLKPMTDDQVQPLVVIMARITEDEVYGNPRSALSNRRMLRVYFGADCYEDLQRRYIGRSPITGE